MGNSVSDILRIDIRQYLVDCINFVNGYTQVLNRYVSDGGQYPRDVYVQMDDLISRYDKIAKSLKVNRDRLSGLAAFEIMDQVENMRSVLRSFENYSRWMKSSIVNGRFVNSAQIIYVLKQNQTIEDMSRSAGYNSGERGFLDLTYRNKISEREYDLSGGLTFKFSYQNDRSIVLDSVVDNMTGDNLLGKDINKKFQFIEDDLLSLSPEDTFNQTCGILVSLTKNSNPEFPDQGFSKDSLSNKNTLNHMLPVFVRQMYSIVSNDDTIASFSITNTSVEGDALRIDMRFMSHLSTEANQTVYGDANI